MFIHTSFKKQPVTPNLKYYRIKKMENTENFNSGLILN